MTTKMILAALAAVLTGTSIESQFHSVDDLGSITTVQAPAPQAADAQDPVAAAAPAQQEQAVSFSIESGTLNDVIRHLKGYRVSFVVADDEANRKISLNFENVPMSEAIEAIGTALGGSFQKKGSVYIFQKGAMGWATAPSVPFATTAPSEIRTRAVPTEARTRAVPDDQIFRTYASPREMTPQEKKAFEKSMTDMEKSLARIKPMQEKEMKALEESLRKMDRKDFAFAAPREMNEKEAKAWAEQMKKQGADVRYYSGPGQAFVAPKAMSEKERKAFEAEMKKFGADMKKFGQEMKLYAPKAMSEKERKAFETEMKKGGDDIRFFMYDGDYKPMNEKDRKAFEADMKKKGIDFKFFHDGKAFAMPPMDEKQRKLWIEDARKRGVAVQGRSLTTDERKEVERAMVEVRRSLADAKVQQGEAMAEARRAMASSEKALKDAKQVQIKAGRTKELYQSITKDQWAKHEKQGFLRISDLTGAQREMLGLSGTGEVTIQMNVDGKKLTIKN